VKKCVNYVDHEFPGQKRNEHSENLHSKYYPKYDCCTIRYNYFLV